MKLGELKDLVEFEAGVTNTGSLGAWIEMTAREILDDLTAQVKHPELLVPDLFIPIVGGTSLYSVGENVQHLDLNSFRYRPGNDEDEEYRLKYRAPGSLSLDGIPQYFHVRQNYTPLAGKVVEIHPNSEMVTGDYFYFNAWYKASIFGDGDETEIFPDSLESTLKRELVARAVLIVGEPKLFTAHRQLAGEARSRSFGAIDVNNANGR